jgi:SAM-dependent methyltransferase
MNSLELAKKKVADSFPYSGYVETGIDATNNIAATVAKYLEPGAKILDFGSGPCDKTAVIQSLGYQCSAFDDLRDDWHLMGDNRSQILEFAKSFGIDFNLAENGYLPFEKESFDMVMMHDVLEHLHDSPRVLLNDLAELVKPGGLLFLTVPSAVNIKKRLEVLLGRTNLPEFSTYYWAPGAWRGHIREYAKNDMVMLSKYLEFSVEELGGCHHMLSVLPNKVRSPYQWLTQVFPDWRDSWMLVARKPQSWQSKRELPLQDYAKLVGAYSPYYKNL